MQENYIPQRQATVLCIFCHESRKYIHIKSFHDCLQSEATGEQWSNNLNSIQILVIKSDVTWYISDYLWICILKMWGTMISTVS